MAERNRRIVTAVTGLSARLLVLTIFFVMLSEVLIYAPSIGRYRKVYLEDRIADAHLVTLALEASPDKNIAKDLERQLLAHARAYGIVTRRGNLPKLMLLRDMPPKVALTVDLRKSGFMDYILDAFDVLVQRENRVMRVIGPSPTDPNALVEVILDEAPMQAEMYDYSERILILSIVISLATAALVYLSLQWLIVRPMRRLAENMTAFSDAPEDRSKLLRPSTRSDEVGLAERQLRAMQDGLRLALKQKERLAALGTAVTKISHDLRNILSTASLVSDRLAGIDDPTVKKVTPTLVRAIDRAVNLCSQTLDYASVEHAEIDRKPLSLRGLVADAAQALPAGKQGAVLDNEVAKDLKINADRDQLYRVLCNLTANAVEAGAGHIRVTAEKSNGQIHIDIADDGSGVDPDAQKNLFKPFAGSTRTGGTGLGLAIASELMEAHDGELSLARTSDEGTVFRLTLPAA